MRCLALRSFLLKSAVPVVSIVVMLYTSPAISAVKGGDPIGENAVNGGFGFQLGLSDWAPGGFKWFNEYNRGLSEHVWLNAQINLSLGNRDRNCWYDSGGNLHCTGDNWSGNSLEFALGPKLRFPVSKYPIIVDAKLGGFLDLLFFNSDYSGVSTGFRGGVGVHFFIFENLGIGAELMCNMGPYIIDGYAGFYATLDFQVLGVEFRF